MTHTKKRRPPIIEQLMVPIYDAPVCLLVHDGDLTHPKIVAKFGKLHCEPSSVGFVHEFKQGFMIALQYGWLTHEVFAHEVFHLTHMIMHRTGDEFSHENQEPYAYLNGHLTEVLRAQLAKHGLRIRD